MDLSAFLGAIPNKIGLTWHKGGTWVSREALFAFPLLWYCCPFSKAAVVLREGLKGRWKERRKRKMKGGNRSSALLHWYGRTEKPCSWQPAWSLARWDHTWLTVTVGWCRWEQDVFLKTEGFRGVIVSEIFLTPFNNLPLLCHHQASWTLEGKVSCCLANSLRACPSSLRISAGSLFPCRHLLAGKSGVGAQEPAH